MSHIDERQRGKTLAERRTMRFENVSLWAVFLVGAIACAISFIALSAVGADAGLGRASFLLPVAIDGFGFACSVGILKSVSDRERLRCRLSEWCGLVGALGLSIMGNTHHALTVGAASMPTYIKISYATAVPIIVAYSIHIYGRAMSKGIAAHILADDPDTVRADIWQVRAVGEPSEQATAPAPHQGASRFADSPAEKEARRLYDELVDATGRRPNAVLIHDQVAHLDGAYTKPQSTRTHIREWWATDPRNPDN